MTSAPASYDMETIARETFGLLGAGRQVPPITDRHPAFDLAAAYRTVASIRRMRIARGERPVGRKIGFTNRTIWDEYGVHAPIWGHVYDSTLHDLAVAGGAFPLGGLVEPRIEPEIVFGLSRAPTPDMTEAALLEGIEWIAHGFEIVQSVFPGWKFRAADTVAAFGLHGALLLGPRHAVAGQDRATWLASLASFGIELRRGDATIDRGRAANVLGGPLSALRHLVSVLAQDPDNPPLAAGELVSTGTLTRAMPVAPGERWSTKLDGVALGGIEIRFAA